VTGPDTPVLPALPLEGAAGAPVDDATVRWFSAEKGYGFLLVGDRDVFVSHRDIAGQGFRTLEPGSRVRCRVERDAAGWIARGVAVATLDAVAS
jgi:cold shock protein